MAHDRFYRRIHCTTVCVKTITCDLLLLLFMNNNIIKYLIVQILNLLFDYCLISVQRNNLILYPHTCIFKTKITDCSNVLDPFLTMSHNCKM